MGKTGLRNLLSPLCLLAKIILPTSVPFSGPVGPDDGPLKAWRNAQKY